VVLAERYGAAGLSILCFPTREFGGQEFGTNAEIATFVKKRFGISPTTTPNLHMLGRTKVKGSKANPAWKWLARMSGNETDPSWNFSTKFLVDRSGEAVGRFDRVNPLDLEDQIKELLSMSGTGKEGK